MSTSSNTSIRTIATGLVGDAALYIYQSLGAAVCALNDIIDGPPGRCQVCGRYKDPGAVTQAAKAVLNIAFSKKAMLLSAMAQQPSVAWQGHLTENEQERLKIAYSVVNELKESALQRLERNLRPVSRVPGPRPSLPERRVEDTSTPTDPDELEL